jgi:hypothetical protein
MLKWSGIPSRLHFQERRCKGQQSPKAPTGRPVIDIVHVHLIKRLGPCTLLDQVSVEILIRNWALRLVPELAWMLYFPVLMFLVFRQCI